MQKQNTRNYLCENKIRETNLLDSMKSVKNSKAPGKDELTKEFYETFLNEPKAPLMESANQAMIKLPILRP